MLTIKMRAKSLKKYEDLFDGISYEAGKSGIVVDESFKICHKLVQKLIDAGVDYVDDKMFVYEMEDGDKEKVILKKGWEEVDLNGETVFIFPEPSSENSEEETEDIDLGDDEEPEEKPKKRGRGRPKKEETEEEEPKKRGRGRPKKEETEEVEEPKKRGRKPKQIDEDDIPDFPEKNLEAEHVAFLISQAVDDYEKDVFTITSEELLAAFRRKKSDMRENEEKYLSELLIIIREFNLMLTFNAETDSYFITRESLFAKPKKISLANLEKFYN